MCSAATSQFWGHGFDPELSSVCSPITYEGFISKIILVSMTRMKQLLKIMNTSIVGMIWKLDFEMSRCTCLFTQEKTEIDTCIYIRPAHICSCYYTCNYTVYRGTSYKVRLKNHALFSHYNCTKNECRNCKCVYVKLNLWQETEFHPHKCIFIDG